MHVQYSNVDLPIYLYEHVFKTISLNIGKEIGLKKFSYNCTHPKLAHPYRRPSDPCLASPALLCLLKRLSL
jgi:hypothetical protein